MQIPVIKGSKNYGSAFGMNTTVTPGSDAFNPVFAFTHQATEPDQYYYHPDHLGSSSYITNADGVVNQHMEYFAFGESFVDEHLNSYNSPYKFNSKELDEETGWYYYGARYYDPRVSLWLGVDPLAEKYPNMSPFNYCANNPVMLIDPDGRALGDHYKTNPDGTISFDFSDSNKGDGKVYIDGQMLPSYSDRQKLKKKIDAHQSNGPTINEIGGRKVPITEYKDGDPNDPGQPGEVLIDAKPGPDYQAGDKSAHVDVASGSYSPPPGKTVTIHRLLWIWHLHPNGGLIPIPDISNGGYEKTTWELAALTPNSWNFNIGPTLNNCEDCAPYPDNQSFTFEPKNNIVYILDYNGLVTQSSFDWFFTIQETQP